MKYIKTCEHCKNSIFEEDLGDEDFYTFKCTRDDLPEDMVDEAFLNDDANNCTGFDPIIIKTCAHCGKKLNIPYYKLKYASRDIGFCCEQCMKKETFSL